MSSSAPTTEVAILTLKPDAPIEDVSTPAGQIFNQMLNTIKSQSGFQRQYWGRQLENPNHLVLSIGKKGQIPNPLPAFLRLTSPMLTFFSLFPPRLGQHSLSHLLDAIFILQTVLFRHLPAARPVHLLPSPRGHLTQHHPPKLSTLPSRQSALCTGNRICLLCLASLGILVPEVRTRNRRYGARRYLPRSCSCSRKR